MIKLLETLNKLNPEIKLYSVRDNEFEKYGRIINIDTKECVDACMSLEFPKDGSAYEPTVKALEDMKCADAIREMTLGGCKVQLGICHGYNTFLNALEYHNCSEINVAATPLVLLLATRWDLVTIKYPMSYLLRILIVSRVVLYLSSAG